MRANEVTRVQRAARALAVAMVSSSSTTEQAAQPQAPRSTGFTFQPPTAHSKAQTPATEPVAAGAPTVPTISLKHGATTR